MPAARERVRHRHAGAGAGGGRWAERAYADGTRRPAGGRAAHDQGSARRGRRAHGRSGSLRRRRSRLGADAPFVAAVAGGGRRDRGQDDHARGGLEGRDDQPRARVDRESLAAGRTRGRLQRRRRGRGGAAAGRRPPRRRRRRLDPHPGVDVRRRSASSRPGAWCPTDPVNSRAVGAGPDRPQRRGRGAAARRHRRHRRGRGAGGGVAGLPSPSAATSGSPPSSRRSSPVRARRGRIRGARRQGRARPSRRWAIHGRWST